MERMRLTKDLFLDLGPMEKNRAAGRIGHILGVSRRKASEYIGMLIDSDILVEAEGKVYLKPQYAVLQARLDQR